MMRKVDLMSFFMSKGSEIILRYMVLKSTFQAKILVKNIIFFTMHFLCVYRYSCGMQVHFFMSIAKLNSELVSCIIPRKFKFQFMENGYLVPTYLNWSLRLYKLGTRACNV